MIKSFKDIIAIAKRRPPKRVVVSAAADEDVLGAIALTTKDKIVQPILVGDKAKIHKIAKKVELDLDGIEIIAERRVAECAAKAVEMVREGHADILMKGLIETSTLLKAVLDKEHGLRINSRLSHLTIAELKNYHKLLAVTDGGVNIKPDVATKKVILENAVHFYQQLGIAKPKVAVASSNEEVNLHMESSIDAALLTMMNRRGQISNCLVDGPLAFDNIISKEACRHKGITTEVGGDADIIVVPEIDSGNILIKTMKYLAGAQLAGIVLGAQSPIVLSSRSDGAKRKYLSLVCASML